MNGKTSEIKSGLLNQARRSSSDNNLSHNQITEYQKPHSHSTASKMSGAAEEDPNATKAVVDDEKNGDKTEPEKKPAASMEGEDEWEEFPQQGKSTHFYYSNTC